MAYAIIAEFQAKPGRDDELERILLETSAYSLDEEPGCLRFEVIQLTDEHGQVLPGKFRTNELFLDWAGVEAHRASPRTPGRIALIREVAMSTVIAHGVVAPDSMRHLADPMVSSRFPGAE